MSLLRSAATVGSITMVSRVLGFTRDILIANVVGTGTVAQAFVVAFRFPNLFRALFAEGAFNSAFVPLFAKRLETEGTESARAFAEEVQAVLFAWLSGLHGPGHPVHAAGHLCHRRRLRGRPCQVRPRRRTDAHRVSLSSVHVADRALERRPQQSPSLRRRRRGAHRAQHHHDRDAGRRARPRLGRR